MIPIDLSLLKGQYVQLELLNENHVQELRALARDERIWEYTKTLLVNDSYDEQFDKYIAMAFDERNTGMQLSFVTRDALSNDIIGMTRYYRIEDSMKRLSIGYTWFVPGCWGLVHNK